MLNLGTGEQMAHTMIASKAVERMFESEDEFAGLQKAIEKDFMGLFLPQPYRPLVLIRRSGSSVVQQSNMSSAVGIMAIKFDRKAKNKRIHSIYGHTTESMVIPTVILSGSF